MEIKWKNKGKGEVGEIVEIERRIQASNVWLAEQIDNCTACRTLIKIVDRFIEQEDWRLPTRHRKTKRKKNQ